jgi:hypothetical protein
MNLKNTFKESGKTLRDVMVVVVGIAITFSLNNWMSNSKERKDMQLYLNAVKTELEDNLNSVENKIPLYQKAVKLSDYLRSHNQDDYQLDSILNYQMILNGVYSFTYRTSAFEMFKMSGAMRLMKDKKLLSAIWDAYVGLEQLKAGNDFYMNQKTDLMVNYFIITRDVIQNNNDFMTIFQKPETKRYFSYLMISWSYVQQFLDGAEQIRETLELIDNYNLGQKTVQNQQKIPNVPVIHP